MRIDDIRPLAPLVRVADMNLPHWRKKFAVAFAGLFHTCRTQSSMRVHCTCGGLVVVLAAMTGVSPKEWAVLLLAIGGVISLELVNTAIEAIVDLVSPQHSELARTAKDTSAAAVLVAAITAIGVGAWIFVPHWWAVLRS